jgi:hypothetical protein
MLQCGIKLFNVEYNLLKIVVITNKLITNHFSGVSLPAFPSDFIKAGFGCCRFFRCGFYDIGLTGAMFFERFGKNMMGTTSCCMVIRLKIKIY